MPSRYDDVIRTQQLFVLMCLSERLNNAKLQRVFACKPNNGRSEL